MQKIKILLLVLFISLFASGCSNTTLDKLDYKENIDTILSNKNYTYNVNFNGYKYYIPRGLVFIDKDEYNSIIRDERGNIYYLYVDSISYYNKINIDYDENNKLYYSKNLNYNKIDGYIQIDKISDKYLIQYMFNYAKVEAYVSKNDLVFTINNMSYLLNSIKYNRKVLGSLVGDNKLSYKEKDYTLFKRNSNRENFLDVVYKNEDKAYKKAVDEERIKLNNE